jgi:hypothetical protein
VVGGDVVLARTRVTPPRLLEPRSTFSLNATGAFGSPGYTGTRRGRLTLTLSLLKIHAGTHAERM